MSEKQKPAVHSRVSIDDGELYLHDKHIEEQPEHLTPDEAVALGYALFEHGLFLKGKMK